MQACRSIAVLLQANIRSPPALMTPKHFKSQW
jgi:hypothetical protein